MKGDKCREETKLEKVKKRNKVDIMQHMIAPGITPYQLSIFIQAPKTAAFFFFFYIFDLFILVSAIKIVSLSMHYSNAHMDRFHKVFFFNKRFGSTIKEQISVQ